MEVIWFLPCSERQQTYSTEVDSHQVTLGNMMLVVTYQWLISVSINFLKTLFVFRNYSVVICTYNRGRDKTPEQWIIWTI